MTNTQSANLSKHMIDSKELLFIMSNTVQTTLKQQLNG